jgi:hypothetical protein
MNGLRGAGSAAANDTCPAGSTAAGIVRAVARASGDSVPVVTGRARCRLGGPRSGNADYCRRRNSCECGGRPAG